MSISKVTVTVKGFVRYGTASSFFTLGRVAKAEGSWAAEAWDDDAEAESLGTFPTKAEAVSAVVEAGRL